MKGVIVVWLGYVDKFGMCKCMLDVLKWGYFDRNYGRLVWFDNKLCFVLEIIFKKKWD